MVVGVHSLDFPRTGMLGVDLFFVLSGFLITTLLFEEHDLNGRIALGAFYIRRIRRLYPALLVLIVVVSLAVVFFKDQTYSLTAKEAAVAATYVTNIAFAWQSLRLPILGEFAHLWSLSAEEQFYLLWPLTLILVGFRRRIAAAIAIFGTLDFLAEQWTLTHRSGVWAGRIQYGPDVRSPTSILIGCLLGVIWSSSGRSLLLKVARWLFTPALLVCATLTFHLINTLYSGWITLFSACAALLLARALDQASPVAHVLRSQPLVWLGKISYSLYLWHVAILYYFDPPGATFTAVAWVAVSIVVATASFYLVERPFRVKATRRERLVVATPWPAALSAPFPAAHRHGVDDGLAAERRGERVPEGASEVPLGQHRAGEAQTVSDSIDQ
jgi:peptidoglycan/LPS O-acetylase OafA/YrhL